MPDAQQGPWKYIVMWLRFYYAFHFLKSGLNYAIFNVIPDFSKAGAVGPYLAEMNNVGFYPFIKYLEIVLGAMLLFNILVPVALAVMAGIAFQIIYLNYFVSPHPRQLFTATQELLLSGLLLLSYGKYYAQLFHLKATPGYPWQSDTPSAAAPRSTPVPAVHQPRAKDYAILLGITVVWTLIVIGFSTTMVQRPLRIYDWGPPVFACALSLVLMKWSDLQGAKGGTPGMGTAHPAT